MRPDVAAALLLALALSACGEEPGPSAPSPPPGLEECQRALDASERVLTETTNVLEAETQGLNPPAESVEAALREAEDAIRECREFSSSASPQVRACRYAARSATRAAENTLRWLTWPRTEPGEGRTLADMAKFFTAEYLAAAAKCRA